MKIVHFHLLFFLLFGALDLVAQTCPTKGDPNGDYNCPDPSKGCNNGGGPQGPGVEIITSGDPNQIIGSSGYSTNKWVSINATLPYKISFENDPAIATAPAQKVVIYMPIHPNINPNSLRLGDFGFGNLLFTLPPNTASYTQRLDVRDSTGVLLDITAGLDMANRRAFWIFQSIDTATGLASTLPANAGFLPVNDSTKHNGEGFVTLTIQPVSTAQTRDSIDAKASIIFDINEVVPTNTWSNIIDAVAPTSKVNNLPAVADYAFIINWSGKDDSLGTGVKYYDLYVSKNNDPFTLYQEKLDTTAASFTGDPGATYSFYTLATDYTGNKEAQKIKGDDTVLVAENISITHNFRSKQNGNWNSISTWESSSDSLAWTTATVTPLYASKHITIQSSHSITVTEDVATDHTVVEPGATLSVFAGKTLTVLNNGLTLRSNADSSASIGASAGSITGNVIVERFIPARRAWRLMTAPFGSSQTINAAWQEGGRNTGGYGTHITGGSMANGFDQSPSNSSSIKWYNQPNNSFDPLDSTLAKITEQPGYFLFVRGDRTVNLSAGTNAPATNTILRATGTLKTGTQPSIPVAANGFTLVGNPYAAPIAFSKIDKTNVPARFWLWDPKGATVGRYVVFDSLDNYAPFPGGGSYLGVNSVIQSAQAFFVEGSGAGAGELGISENSKSATQRNAFRTNDGNDEKMQVILHFYNPNNTTTLADAALTRYNSFYSAAVTAEDAGKPDNIDENVAIIRDGRKLMIERRPLIDVADTTFLKIYNMKQKNYQFEIIPTNFNATTLSAYLEDAYLKTSTPVSLSTSSVITFKITADTATAYPDRFRIVYKTSGALAVNFTSINAYKENSGIQVNWKVEVENNIRHYEVEKSAKGEQFTKAATVVATANNNAPASYKWFDANPFNGDNFYRIKAVPNSGEVKYSEVVNVKIAGGKSSIVIYPNPVKDRTVFVQLNNQAKGRYIVQLFNSLGQQVFSKPIEHLGGSATQTLQLRTVVSKGIYQCQVTNGNNKTTKQIIFE